MYTALLECVTAPGQDGMRFALLLFRLAVFKDLYRKQVFRATVRPWCHLFLRQQTWQEIKLRSRRWSVDVGIAAAISKPGVLPGVICRPVRSWQNQLVTVADRLRSLPALPRPSVPAYWPVQRWRYCDAFVP